MRERAEQRHQALLIADDVPAVAFSSLSLLEPTALLCPQEVHFKKALPSPCLKCPALSPDRIQSSLWPGDQGPSYPDPAAAAAKSLQSCPTLCDPRDGSPPGSPVPGILQARTLEWVAISFSNA